MSELIIHIGAHKTATTTIQKALFDNAKALADSGLIYPRVCWFHYAQHRLAFALRGLADPVRGDRPDLATEVAQLNAVLDQQRSGKVLISSEELFSIGSASIALLRSAVRAERVRIIAFVRRPDEMLLSIYNQKTKSPGNGFARPLDYFVSHPRQIDPDILYAEHIGNWADAFGTDAINLQTYEASPPVEAFFAALGLAALPRLGNGLNQSVPAPVVEVMRLAKAFGFEEQKQRALYELANRQFEGAPRVYLSDEARTRIINHFEAENDALFARFGRENPYQAANHVPMETGTARPNLSYRDLMQVIETLLGSYRN